MRLDLDHDDYDLLREALSALTDKRLDQLPPLDPDAPFVDLRRAVLDATADVDELLDRLDDQAITDGWNGLD